MNAADELIGAFDEGADSDEIHARKGKKKEKKEDKKKGKKKNSNWFQECKRIVYRLRS